MVVATKDRTRPARKGWSAARKRANKHMDFQALTMETLDELVAEYCADPRQERTRRQYMAMLTALRPVQRTWQHRHECCIAAAEGFAPPPALDTPKAS